MGCGHGYLGRRFMQLLPNEMQESLKHGNLERTQRRDAVRGVQSAATANYMQILHLAKLGLAAGQPTAVRRHYLAHFPIWPPACPYRTPEE
jgi:hypothetical protein